MSERAGLPKNIRGQHWILGGLLLLPVLIAFLWMALPSGPAPAETGVVRIAASTPQPAFTPTVAAQPKRPLSPQRNSELADENQYLVAREARDRAWADRSEKALLTLMRGIAQVDSRGLSAKCTTSLCEVSGLALEDPASGSMNPAWEALERDTSGDRLSMPDLERDATTFGTGRVREAFVLYFRRVAPQK